MHWNDLLRAELFRSNRDFIELRVVKIIWSNCPHDRRYKGGPRLQEFRAITRNLRAVALRTKAKHNISLDPWSFVECDAMISEVDKASRALTLAQQKLDEAVCKALRNKLKQIG